MRVSRPSSRLSFDDIIELRFLPSRRRRRDPEYLEQLKSRLWPPEVNYRVRPRTVGRDLVSLGGSERGDG
jgi:hypothetical protein